jgi:hypothetical protein
VPIVRPFSTAAQPSCNALGDGGEASGFPRSVIAMPQPAMPQLGSAAATASKPLRAVSNQNECSAATARVNSS